MGKPITKMLNEIPGVDELHVFSVDSNNFLLQIPTSRIFRIDNLTRMVIEKLSGLGSEEAVIKELRDKHDKEKIREVISELRNQDMIGKKHPEPWEKYQKASNHFDVTSLMLMLASNCNLKCEYCFSEQGTYGGNHSFMSWNVAKAAVDLVFKNTNNTPVALIFFGGEPLLNFRLLKKIVYYSKKKSLKTGKKVYFSITTNGTICTDEITSFLMENRFKTLISIDGPGFIHDKWRKFQNGKGSHDVIVENIKSMILRWQCGNLIADLGARATVTALEPDLTKILPYLESLGFRYVYGEPVFTWPHIIKECTFEKNSVNLYKKGFDNLVKIYAEKILMGESCKFKFLLHGLKMIIDGVQKHYPCGMGRIINVVTTKGDIFPCQRIIAEKNYCIGSVFTGIDENKRTETFPRPVEKKDPCHSCWSRYFCGGGCPSEQIFVNKNDSHPIEWKCDIFKHNIKRIIWLYDKIKNTKPELMVKLVEDLDMSSNIL
ncbi:MAG: radical SAM protein [Actinomycetota bacterium]|nr:radical SAM protein [Actinomycetota bacterium]